MMMGATMTPAEYLVRPYGWLFVLESDGTWFGQIVEFPGCIATGETAEGAMANLRDVAESWICSALSLGQSIPEPLAESAPSSASH